MAGMTREERIDDVLATWQHCGMPGTREDAAWSVDFVTATPLFAYPEPRDNAPWIGEAIAATDGDRSAVDRFRRNIGLPVKS